MVLVKNKMFVLVITLGTVIGAVYGQSIIIEGEGASVQQFPYMVSFQFGSGDFAGVHFCSGFLISPLIVVTAAHCVYDLNSSEIKTYRVRAGSSFYNTGGQLVQVDQAIAHPGFDELTNDNDIALVKLATAITDKNVKFANLPRQDEDIPDIYLNVTGWGTIKEGNEIPGLLQLVQLKKISTSSCERIYVTKKITANMYCATSRDKRACSADCGDPATKGNTVYGIWSSGINCVDAKYPSIYTRLPLFRDWIFKNSGI